MTLYKENIKDGFMLSSQRELIKAYPETQHFVEFFWNNLIILKSMDKKNIFCVYMFTDNYQYSIYVHDDYCGSYLKCRKHGIMEDWLRGNDLPDGELSKEIFDRITYTILRCELENIGPIVYKEHIRYCEDSDQKPTVETNAADNNK